MKRRSPEDGLIKKHLKKIEEVEFEEEEKHSDNLVEEKQPEEKVVLKPLEVVLEDKQFERLENIKKETIEKLIKQQENDKPKHKKKKKVVYVSESDDEVDNEEEK
jgi:hypothetical protein